jgi:hypothetical protein
MVRTKPAASLRAVLERLQDVKTLHVRFIIVTPGTYPVEKLAAAAQVKDKVQVVRCLDISVKGPLWERSVGIPPRNNHKALQYFYGHWTRVSVLRSHSGPISILVIIAERK